MTKNLITLIAAAAVLLGCNSTGSAERELGKIYALEGSSRFGVQREPGTEIKSVALEGETIVLKMDAGRFACSPKVYPVRVLYRNFVLEIPTGAIGAIDEHGVLVYKGEIVVRFEEKLVKVPSLHRFSFIQREMRQMNVSY
jgi:hypothetical protein